MSEEESNNEGEENEDNENEEDEGEGEEKEDDENGEEGEEEEDDDKGEENEDEEGEGEENEDDNEEDEENEDNKKKKKGKKKEKKEEEKKEEEKPPQSTKFSEDKLLPSKEIKMDLNFNSSNSNNIYFNGNDITLANIIPPKKSTLQLLMEISSDMESLSTHLEKVLPPPPPLKFNIDYPISNPSIDIKNLNINMDNQDYEIKQLIEKANELTNNSILNAKKKENGEIKTYEDKCCQSDDEIENSYNQQLEENKSRDEFYNNNNYYNENINRRRFPYDPYKHLEYYNDLKNNNNDYYRRRPFIYSQPENNNMQRNDIPFERYKPGNISQAMDILLDKK